VAEARLDLQRVKWDRLIFIDQAQIKVGNGPLKGLAPAGKPAVDVGKTARQWGERLDFMGAVCGEGQVAFNLRTAKDRQKAKCKGWKKDMILRFIRDEVAGYCVAHDLEGAVVVVDKALRVTVEDVLSEMKRGGAERATKAMVMPTSSAKYISPLDNNLWHEMKHNLRNRACQDVKSLVTATRQVWAEISREHIQAYYRNCALQRRADPYYGRVI
jgi:hypothetical protein